jgi:hypothetical protein
MIGGGNIAMNVMQSLFVDMPNTGTSVEKQEGMMVSRLHHHPREKGIQ